MTSSAELSVFPVKNASNLVTLIGVLVLVLFIAPFSAVHADSSVPSLFRLVKEGVDYYLVSDNVFSLNVYVLNLPDVGNYRVSNHTAFVEGVEEGAEINPFENGSTRELLIPLPGPSGPMFPSFVARIEVNISCIMVDSWGMYRDIIESGNNSVIVNTHDEYFPVPAGYSKVEWTGRVADFMLNRWGTWVNAGGYAFYRVWYQNGTTELWGEAGLQELMRYIGKPNIQCRAPTQYPDEDFSGYFGQQMWLSFFAQDAVAGYAQAIANFGPVMQGFPLNSSDVGDQVELPIYSYGVDSETYYSGAVIRFSQNKSSSSFGRFVYMGSWELNAGGRNYLSALGCGFVPTAAAVYAEFSAVLHIYGVDGYSASEAIQKAENESRTTELTQAKAFLNESLNCYSTGAYKEAQAYAEQAKTTADLSTAVPSLSSTLLGLATPILSAAVMVGVTYGVCVYYVSKRRKTRKDDEGNP